MRFAPIVAGSLAASLVVSSDAATGDQTIELAGTATDAPPPPSTVALDRAAFRVTWRKGVPSGSIQVAGTTGGAASLTFTLRRVTASGTRPVKGWTFQQPGAGPFARALALPKTLLPGTFRLDVTGSSPGGTVPRVSRDLKLKGPPEGIVKDAFASSTKAGAAATRLPGRRTEVWATFVFSALPSRGTDHRRLDLPGPPARTATGPARRQAAARDRHDRPDGAEHRPAARPLHGHALRRRRPDAPGQRADRLSVAAARTRSASRSTAGRRPPTPAPAKAASRAVATGRLTRDV